MTFSFCDRFLKFYIRIQFTAFDDNLLKKTNNEHLYVLLLTFQWTQHYLQKRTTQRFLKMEEREFYLL